MPFVVVRLDFDQVVFVNVFHFLSLGFVELTLDLAVVFDEPLKLFILRLGLLNVCFECPALLLYAVLLVLDSLNLLVHLSNFVVCHAQVLLNANLVIG